MSVVSPVQATHGLGLRPAPPVERPAEPSVSVVICTIRPAGLADAVASVLANDGPPFDLIVVAQGPDAAWAHDALDALPDMYRDDPRLRIVHDAGRGLSHARNVGVRESAGEIVIFTDDDCTVATDWVASHVACFRERPDAVLVYGAVEPPAGYTGADGFVPTFEPAPQQPSTRIGGGIVMGMGANMSVRRSVFGRIGPFDEQLGAGAPLMSAEDLDISLRAHAAGLVALADRRPLVIHALGVRGRGRESRTLWMRDGVGLGAAVAKLVRIGQWRAARATIGVLVGIWRDALTKVAAGQRPFGLAMVGMLTLGTLNGFARGIRQPLRRSRTGYLYTPRG